jgi:hypothetical protein
VLSRQSSETPDADYISVALPVTVVFMSLATVNFADEVVGVVVAGVFAAGAFLFDELLPHPALAIAAPATNPNRRISGPRS